MIMNALCFLLFSLAIALGHPLQQQQQQERLDSNIVPPPELQGWFDPNINGGSLLDYTNEKFGEPLNVIISGLSDPFILTDHGFRTYVKSIGYADECLDIHLGVKHSANLGDGDELKEQQWLARQYYFPIMGTCWESIIGGHHFRAWKQNGTLANSGAWFLGASKEYPSSKHHMIVPDGYNIGRNWLVAQATAGSHYGNKFWKAEVEWRDGLLEPGKHGVNHGIEQDGVVAILTVNRV